MRFAAPALMAGNVGLLKHASNVPQTALFMQDLFARAGFPAGTFQTLLVSSRRVEPILRDERVVAATKARVRLGDPFALETTMGPLNNEATAAKFDRHIAGALAGGARVCCGGRRAPGFPRLGFPAATWPPP